MLDKKDPDLNKNAEIFTKTFIKGPSNKHIFSKTIYLMSLVLIENPTVDG